MKEKPSDGELEMRGQGRGRGRRTRAQCPVWPEGTQSGLHPGLTEGGKESRIPRGREEIRIIPRIRHVGQQNKLSNPYRSPHQRDKGNCFLYLTE